MRHLQTLSEGKAIVQLVLPPSWITRLNQQALERGMNRSALIRAAIAAAYFNERSEVDAGSRGEIPPHHP